MDCQSKGARRRRLDLIRLRQGEPKVNLKKNRDLNCSFAKDGKAFRNKGLNRFKTGKKRQKKGKSQK